MLINMILFCLGFEICTGLKVAKRKNKVVRAAFQT